MKKIIALILTLALTVAFAGCLQTTEPHPTATSDLPGDIAASTDIPRTGTGYVYMITDGPFAPYVAGKVIAEDKIGEKIADVSLRAGWRQFPDGEWIDEETLRGEVYAIRNISGDIAVALRFLDPGEAVTTTHYYVIMNPDADLSTVEEYSITPLFTNTPGEE